MCIMALYAQCFNVQKSTDILKDSILTASLQLCYSFIKITLHKHRYAEGLHPHSFVTASKKVALHKHIYAEGHYPHSFVTAS